MFIIFIFFMFIKLHKGKKINERYNLKRNSFNSAVLIIQYVILHCLKCQQSDYTYPRYHCWRFIISVDELGIMIVNVPCMCIGASIIGNNRCIHNILMLWKRESNM